MDTYADLSTPKFYLSIVDSKKRNYFVIDNLSNMIIDQTDKDLLYINDIKINYIDITNKLKTDTSEPNLNQLREVISGIFYNFIKSFSDYVKSAEFIKTIGTSYSYIISASDFDKYYSRFFNNNIMLKPLRSIFQKYFETDYEKPKKDSLRTERKLYNAPLSMSYEVSDMSDVVYKGLSIDNIKTYFKESKKTIVAIYNNNKGQTRNVSNSEVDGFDVKIYKYDSKTKMIYVELITPNASFDSVMTKNDNSIVYKNPKNNEPSVIDLEYKGKDGTDYKFLIKNDIAGVEEELKIFDKVPNTIILEATQEDVANMTDIQKNRYLTDLANQKKTNDTQISTSDADTNTPEPIKEEPKPEDKTEPTPTPVQPIGIDALIINWETFPVKREDVKFKGFISNLLSKLNKVPGKFKKTLDIIGLTGDQAVWKTAMGANLSGIWNDLMAIKDVWLKGEDKDGKKSQKLTDKEANIRFRILSVFGYYLEYVAKKPPIKTSKGGVSNYDVIKYLAPNINEFDAYVAWIFESTNLLFYLYDIQYSDEYFDKSKATANIIRKYIKDINFFMKSKTEDQRIINIVKLDTLSILDEYIQYLLSLQIVK